MPIILDDDDLEPFESLVDLETISDANTRIGACVLSVFNRKTRISKLHTKKKKHQKPNHTYDVANLRFLLIIILLILLLLLCCTSHCTGCRLFSGFLDPKNSGRPQ